MNSSAPNTSFLKVTFLDVENADSILIQTNDTTILIDGGDTYTDTKVTKTLKNLGVSTINHLFLTHPHKDHYGGLYEISKNFNIQNFYTSYVIDEDIELQKTIKSICKNSSKEYTVKTNDKFDVSNNLTLECLSPSKLDKANPNNSSLVLRLDYNKYSFLFTGDIEKDIENKLLEENIDVDFLKVAHHGSKTSSSDTFLSKVTPAFSVISVGKYNRFNHPSPETISNLNKYTSKSIFRTDQNGNITILIENGRCKISSSSKSPFTNIK